MNSSYFLPITIKVGDFLGSGAERFICYSSARMGIPGDTRYKFTITNFCEKMMALKQPSHFPLGHALWRDRRIHDQLLTNF